MNAFRTRQIRKKSPLQLFKILKKGLCKCTELFSGTSKKHVSYFFGFISIIIAVFIIFKVTTGIYYVISNFDIKNLALSFGTDLKKDQYGFTNIVLLGDGGHERDGADLIDTIIVASLDHKNKAVSMLSVPRDYFINNKKYGSARINSFYAYSKNKLGKDKAYGVYQEILNDILDLDIQYYLRVDFNAFVEVIDSLGGITVDVKKTIYDPYYPNNTDNGYTVFEIKKGINNLDGETALKFVRSRKTTSDFDRAARQQQVLIAIQEKALSGNVLKNPKTIKNLYKSINDNLNTNLTTRELISLASFAQKLDRNNLITKVLHDDPSRDGGFLYTPEREQYNGQYVLIPYDTMDIKKYAELIFYNREIYLKPAKIEILNASSMSGIAGKTYNYLKNYGFNIVNLDNYLDSGGKRAKLTKSLIQYNKKVITAGTVTVDYNPTANALSKFIHGSISAINQSDSNSVNDISIILGEDYQLY